MDVKIESKILLSAFAAFPLGLGITLAYEGLIFGWFLIIVALIVFGWLWVPRTWFQKKEKHAHK